MSQFVPENYIYISHLGEMGEWWWLPCCPDKITDSMSSNFSSTTALGRSAPVQVYQGSGPRTVQIALTLRRDMMDEYNENNTSLNSTKPTAYPTSYRVATGEDYVDSLIRGLQSISVPKYTLSSKTVEPPLVTMRLSNDIFIKGIVTGAIGVEYNLPIFSNGKYAEVQLSITVTEVDPYDATSVFKNGSFRGVVQTLKDKTGLSSKDKSFV